MRTIGLISGTSYDAIEAAVADLELVGSELRLRPLGSLSVPYSVELRRDITAAMPPAAVDLEAVCRLDTRIGQAFAGAAALANERFAAGRSQLVASHGQTLFHWVAEGRVEGTLQLGQPAWIAERTGLPVVSDLRNRDIAAGGQGAPLVSLLDVLWLRGRPGVPAALNLGGIANLTVVPVAEPARAFDVGPANALLDNAAAFYSGGRRQYDRDGELAAQGKVQPNLLEALLGDPYYYAPAPKSTGREHFHLQYLLRFLQRAPGISHQDVLATLCRLTARTVATSCHQHRVTELITSGGGTRNPVLMRMLAEELPDARIVASGELGLPASAKEAYAFALLGFLSLHGLPGTVPSCTGARGARILGSLTPGSDPLAVTPAINPQPPQRLQIIVE